MRLARVPGTYAIVRLPPGAAVPTWGTGGGLYSLTRTPEETSLVCIDADVPPEVQAERGWAALRVAGTLDFALTGVLASLAAPLAAAGVSLFAVSTFDTDYILVKTKALEPAVAALHAAGFVIDKE